MKTLSHFLLCIAFLGSASVYGFEATSPNGKLRLQVRESDSGRLSYTLHSGEVIVLEESWLGVTVGSTDFGRNAEILGSDKSSIDETYPSLWMHATAVDRCNVYVLKLKDKPSDAEFDIHFRLYNDGLAFRYHIPGEVERVFTRESTSWNLPDDCQVWHQSDLQSYEKKFYLRDIGQMMKGQSIGMPITVILPEGGGYAAITEGALFDFSGVNLRKHYDGTSELLAEYNDNHRGWVIDGPVTTPWRIVIVSPDLHGLVNSDIVMNVNKKPGELFKDAEEWIKPGRCLWSWLNGARRSVTPENMRHYVDVAAELGWEYVLVDEGWQEAPPVWSPKPGWNTDEQSSLEVLKELVDYADKKGVKIWVWKHFHLLRSRDYRREFFAALHKTGVVGVKLDFIESESTVMIDFYEGALRDAAEFKLMVNFHGANKPTGESRRFPNEIAREAVKGLEYRYLNADHNATLPFTRLVAGHADYTPMHFNKAWMANTTAAHQIGTGIIYSTPVTFFAGNPDDYLNSPARDLIAEIPATWDETVVLPQSEIGTLAAFARRKGSDWFIGALNGRSREYSFKLDLKSLGVTDSQVLSFSDVPGNVLELKKEERRITDSNILEIKMQSNGGFAAMISPAK